LSDTRKWRVSDLEKKVRMSIKVLEALLVTSEVPRRGTVLADMIYRAEQPSAPDGMPRSSMAAAPALLKPASDPALRTHPDDPLRRKREHGYQDDSSVESAVEDLMNDVCERCEGRGNVVCRVVDDQSGVDRAEPTYLTCGQCDGTGRRWADPVGEAVEDLCTRLYELSGHAVVINKRRQVVIGAAGNTRGKPADEYCEGCHRPRGDIGTDPFRRGLCSSCAQAWYEWRKDVNRTDDESSDRMRFCAQRDRFEGHHEFACEKCAEGRQRADESWRVEQVTELQASKALPPRRTA
jgi:hypothetical protein